jgi:hypothetical protein
MGLGREENSEASYRTVFHEVRMAERSKAPDSSENLPEHSGPL